MKILTFDDPVTGCSPTSAYAEVTDSERLRVVVGQERRNFILLANVDGAVVPPWRNSNGQ